MIALEGVFELVKLALLSAYLEGERPLSLLLSAPIEAGKTEVVRAFGLNNSVVYINDFTPTGFVRQYEKELRLGVIKHILVPDLLTPLSKQYYSQQSLIAFLNGLTEEGIAKIHTMFAHLSIKSPHPIGLIGGVTKERLDDQRKHWASVGFLSRMLPVTWKYGDSTVNGIMQYIIRREYTEEKPIIFTPPKAGQVLLPPALGERLRPLADPLLGAEKAYGFRYQRHFQRLAMASALEAGRYAVKEEDVERVERLGYLCNLGYTEL